MKPSTIPSADIEVADDPQRGSVWRLTGAWRAQTAVGAKKRLDQLATSGSQPVEIDLSGIEGMDTAGAWLIRQAMSERTANGAAPRTRVRRRCTRCRHSSEREADGSFMAVSTDGRWA